MRGPTAVPREVIRSRLPVVQSPHADRILRPLMESGGDDGDQKSKR